MPHLSVDLHDRTRRRTKTISFIRSLSPPQLRPSQSLEKILEEYRLLKLTCSEMETQGDGLLAGLCEKLESIVNQIKSDEKKGIRTKQMHSSFVVVGAYRRWLLTVDSKSKLKTNGVGEIRRNKKPSLCFSRSLFFLSPFSIGRLECGPKTRRRRRCSAAAAAAAPAAAPAT